MITYWVDSGGESHFRTYLEQRGASIRDRFLVRSYEIAEAAVEVPGGPQIFAALDQLSEVERRLVNTLRDQLVALDPGVPVLNDPAHCLLRPALLTRLADLGINSFRAYDPREAGGISRFPVFIRGAYDHFANKTGLLSSPGEVQLALRSLRFQGHRPEDLLIVEYCDTSDRHGIFRKYGATKVGETIIPVHMLAGRDWVMKGRSAVRTADFAQESLEYAERNPHEAWLREVFAIAGTEFGRADYAVSENGRPQLWEINTHPSLRAHTRTFQDQQAGSIWGQIRELAHSRIREAFTALDRDQRSSTLTLPVDASLRAQAMAARRQGQRRRKAASWWQAVYRSRLGRPVRMVLEKGLARPPS